MDKSKFIYNKFNELDGKKALRLCFTIPTKKRKEKNRQNDEENVRLWHKEI